MPSTSVNQRIRAQLHAFSAELPSGHKFVAHPGWLFALASLDRSVAPGIVLATDGVLNLELRFRAARDLCLSYRTQLSPHDFFRPGNRAHRTWPGFTSHIETTGELDTREDARVEFEDGTTEVGRLKYVAVSLAIMLSEHQCIMRARWQWQAESDGTQVMQHRAVEAFRATPWHYFLWRPAYRPLSRFANTTGPQSLFDIVRVNMNDSVADLPPSDCEVE